MPLAGLHDDLPDSGNPGFFRFPELIRQEIRICRRTSETGVSFFDRHHSFK